MPNVNSGRKKEPQFIREFGFSHKNSLCFCQKASQGDSLASFPDFGIKNFYGYETAEHFKMMY